MAKKDKEQPRKPDGENTPPVTWRFDDWAAI
jgi:hypothetical protein